MEKIVLKKLEEFTGQNTNDIQGLFWMDRL